MIQSIESFIQFKNYVLLIDVHSILDEDACLLKKKKEGRR